MPFQRIPNKSTPAIVVSTTGNEYRQSHDNYVPNKRSSRKDGLVGNCCRTPSGGWLRMGHKIDRVRMQINALTGQETSASPRIFIFKLI